MIINDNKNSDNIDKNDYNNNDNLFMIVLILI